MPTFHNDRIELIQSVETTMADLWSRLSRYRDRYDCAVDAALRSRLPQG